MQVPYEKAICSGCGKSSEKRVLGVEGPYSVPELPWVTITVRNELYPGGKAFFACSAECCAITLKSVSKHVRGLLEMLKDEQTLKQAQERVAKFWEERKKRNNAASTTS